MKVEPKRPLAAHSAEGRGLSSRKRESTRTPALVWCIGIAAVPLLDVLLNVGPPYPLGTPLITSLVAFAAAFGVFRGVIPRKRMPLTMSVLVISVIVYAGLPSPSSVSERTRTGGTNEW